MCIGESSQIPSYTQDVIAAYCLPFCM
jgi:hypothetical protein